MDLSKIIDQEFELDDDIIYLNHAAVSPWPRRTTAAVQAFAEENCITGATHYPDWMAKEQHCRKQLQQLINAPSVDSCSRSVWGGTAAIGPRWPRKFVCGGW